MNKTTYFIITLEIILACSVALNVFFYAHYQSVMPSLAEASFNREFGHPTIVSPNLSFSPPITMYQALKIALESDDWNATSLINETVTISLDYMRFTNSSNGQGFETLWDVTRSVSSYADQRVNSTMTYRYIWDIDVTNNQRFFGLTGLYYVDAQTGEIVPHPPIYY